MVTSASWGLLYKSQIHIWNLTPVYCSSFTFHHCHVTHPLPTGHIKAASRILKREPCCFPSLCLFRLLTLCHTCLLFPPFFEVFSDPSSHMSVRLHWPLHSGTHAHGMFCPDLMMAPLTFQCPSICLFSSRNLLSQEQILVPCSSTLPRIWMNMQ